MKVLREKVVHGRQQMTIELAEGETIIPVRANAHYRLGAQHGDVVPAEALVETEQVSWCHIEQGWRA